MSVKVKPRRKPVKEEEITEEDVAAAISALKEEMAPVPYEFRYADEDIKGRRLYINKDIDETIIDDIGYHILRFNREDKDLAKDERKPIYLYINSNGGSVPDGMALVSLIEASKTPVYTVCMGYCYSMGLLIFLTGEKRYCLKTSYFLLHQMSSSYPAMRATSKWADSIDFDINIVESQIKNLVTSRTLISEKTYFDRYHDEWFFDAATAKALGVTDFIVGTNCDMDDLY